MTTFRLWHPHKVSSSTFNAQCHCIMTLPLLITDSGDSECTSRGGTCKYTSSICTGGSYTAGLCSGPTDRQCCIPNGKISYYMCIAISGIPIPGYVWLRGTELKLLQFAQLCTLVGNQN